jgi:hypothetical protein
MKVIKEFITWGVTTLPPLKEISSRDLLKEGAPKNGRMDTMSVFMVR